MYSALVQQQDDGNVCTRSVHLRLLVHYNVCGFTLLFCCRVTNQSLVSEPYEEVTLVRKGAQAVAFMAGTLWEWITPFFVQSSSKGGGC